MNFAKFVQLNLLNWTKLWLMQCPVKFHRGKKAQKSGKTVENIQLQNVFSTQFVWLVSLFLVFAKFCATLSLYNIVLLMCVDFVYILSRGVSIKGKGGISKTETDLFALLIDIHLASTEHWISLIISQKATIGLLP